MASSPVAMLANLLHRMRSVEENQSQSSAMLNKLALQMEDVTTRVHELEFSHNSALREINNLLQRFGEQMAITRRKEQEKARLAFMHLREEMEEEKNSCRVLKIQNKKLTKDLTHANMATADACEELERERKARKLLEGVCDELAREIGEDKAEVEQLKQEQVESRKRLEEEIKMMRMAAMWRGERVRSKLSEVQIELDNDKEDMPLHELRSKLEAFLSTIGVTCRGTQDESEVQAEHAKLLRRALELLELEELRKSQGKVFSSATRLANAPACPNASSVDDKVSTNTEYGGEGHHFNGDADAVNGVGSKFSSKDSRKPHKNRRHMRMIAQQRHNSGIKSQVRVYDHQDKVNFWGMHCANSGWSTSDDEQERGTLDTLPKSTQEGYALEQGAKGHNLHMHANSLNLENDNIFLASNQASHTVQMMRPSLFSRSSEPTVETAPCHAQPSLQIGIAEGSPRRHSSSAHFGVEAGRELDCKLVELDTGPSMHYSFSEDDATSYMGSRLEQRQKQQSVLHAQSMQLASTPRQEEEESFNFIRNDQYSHDHLNGSKVRGEAGTENSELDEFYFEPVRGPHYTSLGKLSVRADEDEEGTNTARQNDRGFSNCGDEACCQILAKAGQTCKDVKDKVHNSIEGNTNFGGKEAINKMSPRRSASAKPLQCFWPPSPDTFPMFGGVKKCSKSGSSTPPAHFASEQQIHGVGGLRSHSQRDPSPAKEASFKLSASQHQQDVSMKSNSLGAQLKKAREHDCNKPVKSSFRFSPLRRAISHA